MISNYKPPPMKWVTVSKRPVYVLRIYEYDNFLGDLRSACSANTMMLLDKNLSVKYPSDEKEIL